MSNSWRLLPPTYNLSVTPVSSTSRIYADSAASFTQPSLDYNHSLLIEAQLLLWASITHHVCSNQCDGENKSDHVTPSVVSRCPTNKIQSSYPPAWHDVPTWLSSHSATCPPCADHTGTHPAPTAQSASGPCSWSSLLFHPLAQLAAAQI